MKKIFITGRHGFGDIISPFLFSIYDERYEVVFVWDKNTFRSKYNSNDKYDVFELQEKCTAEISKYYGKEVCYNNIITDTDLHINITFNSDSFIHPMKVNRRINKRKIVWWDWRDNIEEPTEIHTLRSYKQSYEVNITKEVNRLQQLYPGYEFVRISYRDSLDETFEKVKDASFAIGYDGLGLPLCRLYNIPMFISTFSNKITLTQAPWAMTNRSMDPNMYTHLREYIEYANDIKNAYMASEKKRRGYYRLNAEYRN